VAALLVDSENRALLSANVIANLPEVDQAHGDPALLAPVFSEERANLELQEISFYSPDFQPGDPAFYYDGPLITRRFQTSERTTRIRDQLILEALETGRATSSIAIAPQSSQVIGAAPVQAMGTGAEVEGVILAVFAVEEAYIANIAHTLGTDVAIVSENAVIVSTIDQASGYEFLLQEGFNNPSNATTSTNITYADGRQFRLLASPLTLNNEVQGTVLVAQPISQLFQVRQDVQIVLFIFAAVVTLASLLIAFILMLAFARPLARLAQATTLISEGQLDQRVETSYFIFKDEITDLAENFNNMAEHLQELYASLEQRVEKRTRELVEERNKLDKTLAELAVARDQAVEANRAKSEFISVVTHELKSPIAAVKGYGDLLLMGAAGKISEQQTEFVEVIQVNADRMNRLTSDLADVSRIESGHLRLELEPTPLNNVVNEIIKSTRAQLESKNQQLINEVPEDLPWVLADRSRLIQIMTNLVSNAHKYTPENGEITIYAEQTRSLWSTEGDADILLVAVRDNGIGISPEDQSFIFQKFFRAADEKARLSPGTGLGLNITKNLVEMQGGYICFESEYRQGTTFYFTIPFVNTEENVYTNGRK
jgi:signal transduction histidine kinase